MLFGGLEVVNFQSKGNSHLREQSRDVKFCCPDISVANYEPAATPRGFTLPRMNSMMESIGVPG